MISETIKNSWKELTSASMNEDLKESFFKEIIDSYSRTKRKYHTLHHLDALFKLSSEYKNEIEDIQVVHFSIFYHDIIYNVTRSDNEEKSAFLATKRLTELSVSKEKIDLIALFIRCTKDHQPEKCTLEKDLCYFLDFDLSVLGSEPFDYIQYTKTIREEYKLYPDFLYNKGRKKVIEHFLGKEKLFLTESLRERFERQARYNLSDELKTL